MERRTLWQAAWGVVAAIAVAFDAGLVIARITSDAPLWAIGVATVVMLVALYFVFAPLTHTWPSKSSAPAPPLPARHPLPFLHASRGSHIKGDLSIVGTPDFQLVSAEDRSEVTVSGDVLAGPVPPTIASSLTDDELGQKVVQAISDLRAFAEEMTAAEPRFDWPPGPAVTRAESDQMWDEMQAEKTRWYAEEQRRYIEAGWPERLPSIYGDLAARGYAPPRHAGAFAWPRMHKDIGRFELALANLRNKQ